MGDRHVPGTALFSLPLIVPRSSQYTEIGVPPEATAEEVRAAAGRHDARLRAGRASAQEIAAAHVASLESAEARAAHDARRPPLPLLRLEPTWEPFLEDRDAALTVLRREIEDFLTAAGDEVRHPMDTTRADFTGDFNHTHLLDGPAGESAIRR